MATKLNRTLARQDLHEYRQGRVMVLAGNGKNLGQFQAEGTHDTAYWR
jgi:hypothetical protein